MNVLLGVSGSVAAYRAADLAREMMRDGHTVRTCLTTSASKFVTPALFEALTSQPCLVGPFEEPEPGRMAHLDWAKWADLLIVAPATANVISKLAYGIADDMLSTIAVATDAPLLVAPAMNPHMYASEQNQAAIAVLAKRALSIVEPIEGDVACGDFGQGKLASIAQIVTEARAILARSSLLKGKRVLITSGPTQEPIDSVRFLTNRSSGKMGAALARAALVMGAEVSVIAGPSSAHYPIAATVVNVRTAAEMLEAGKDLAPSADIMIGAAAVADYHSEEVIPGKMRRSAEPLDLRFIPNPDVIAELVKLNPKAIGVGFAAEPGADLTVVREKLQRKGLAAIAANDVSRSDIGFDADQNELTLVRPHGEPAKSGLRSKLGCALWLLEQLAD